MEKEVKHMKMGLEKKALKLLLLLLAFNNLNAQQRTWMLPYYQSPGSVSPTGGVNMVPIINFKTGVPKFETQYIGGSFSTQAIGNGEYCNNCASNQLTKLSQFFVSGRAADPYQGNTYSPPLRTLYAKWDQICGDTARVDTFLTTTGSDLAHESLNEVAIGDGETPGTFWVAMQQSPPNEDGYGPGFYVYLMNMNNGTINSNTVINLNHTNYPQLPDFSQTTGPATTGNIDGIHGVGEGVALGSRFMYVKDPSETNTQLIALNGRYCRSIYFANYNTVYHFLLDVVLKTVVYSDQTTMTGSGLNPSATMFMEIDLNYPKNGNHPTNLGLTGWGGVYVYNISPTTGKFATTTQPNITTSAGGYGLEFDKNGNYVYYSLHGSGVVAPLYRVPTSAINSTTAFSPTLLTITPALVAKAGNNYLAIESAIDGNIYAMSSNQELVTIIHPELGPSTASSTLLTASSFVNPATNVADLNPTNQPYLFGMCLPDWVDGEVPHTSEGGTIAVKVPCNLCDESYASHTIDIYSGTTQTSASLIQHYNLLPCDSVAIKVCPGLDYHVIYDMGLPDQQDSWQTIAFAGDYHLVTFNLSPYSSNYMQYNTNTTITTNTLWDNKVYIADNVIVTVAAGATLDITTVDVIFGSDAGIDFKDGAILRATNSVFRPCNMNNVWRGLAFYTTTVPPLGMINTSTFKNAKTAIEAIGTSSTSFLSLDLRITNNVFADCQRGIGLNNVNFIRSISGNTYMLEDKYLPFTSINSSSINPPKTLAPTNQNDYYGIFSNYATFTDLIGQNNFIMTSDSTNGDQMSYGISLYNSTSPVISTNTLTDFSYGITTYSASNVSIEDNSLQWTNLYKKVIPSEYKDHISSYYGKNILIKGNKVYSANLISTNPGILQLDGGANGPSSPAYKSCGIGIQSCNNVVVKQNEITGIETGIVTIGGTTAGPSTNLYIADNQIEKSWYYGVYIRSYENVDIACNSIDMELKTGRDATGIGYFNLSISGITYAHPVNFAIRSNCVLNTKNAIYCYSPTGGFAGQTNMPKVYNNFCYNYTRVGFENNGFTKVSTSSPYEVNRNTFTSNNSMSTLADIISDASHPITCDYNYGVQNVSSGSIQLLYSNNGNSSASCGTQITTNADNLDSSQTCSYFYQNKINWTPNGRLSNGLASTDSTVIVPVNDTFQLSDPIYGSYTAADMINVSQKIFNMYPVPSTDKVTIEYSIDKADNAFIDIMDMQGRVLKTVALTFDLTTLDINISDLIDGVYVVRMTNAGKTSAYSKLIKQ